MLSSTFGVKKTLLVEYTAFFHTSAVDIMHDLLEGVVQYELKLVFQYLVNQKFLSLELLSQRIQSFNYSYNERNKQAKWFKDG